MLGLSLAVNCRGAQSATPSVFWVLNADETPVAMRNYVWIDTSTWDDTHNWKDTGIGD